MAFAVGEVVGKSLKEYGVSYVVGLPVHDNWSLLVAFLDPVSRIFCFQVMYEQGAAHIANSYCRSAGRPSCASISIGPSATNTVAGRATASRDSMALVLIPGSAATHMRGHGVVQEFDCYRALDFPAVASAVIKRNSDVIHADIMTFVMHQTFNGMLTGRPGPLHIEIPLDVQVQQTDINVQQLKKFIAPGLPWAESKATEQAVEMKLEAERPCTVVGDRAIFANAYSELAKLVEALAIPAVFTWNGKCPIAEPNRIFVGTFGWRNSLSSNNTAVNADALMSVGRRVSQTDWRRLTAKVLPSLCCRLSLSMSTFKRTKWAKTTRSSSASPAIFSSSPKTRVLASLVIRRRGNPTAIPVPFGLNRLS